MPFKEVLDAFLGERTGLCDKIMNDKTEKKSSK